MSDIPNIPNPLKESGTPQDAVHQANYVPQPNLNDLERRIADLEIKRVVFSTGLIGGFQVVSVAPTGVPKDVYDQIKIYRNSTTYRLYWYDGSGWRYASGT